MPRSRAWVKDEQEGRSGISAGKAGGVGGGSQGNNDGDQEQEQVPGSGRDQKLATEAAKCRNPVLKKELRKTGKGRREFGARMGFPSQW